MTEQQPGSAAFSLGKGARIGKIDVGGSMAGRDVVVGTAPADEASAQDMAQILELVKRIEEQLAGLAEAPAGLRDDAQDELRKAHQAGAQGDTQRLVEKLGTAQGYLERIGQSLPAAVASRKGATSWTREASEGEHRRGRRRYRVARARQYRRAHDSGGPSREARLKSKEGRQS